MSDVRNRFEQLQLLPGQLLQLEFESLISTRERCNLVGYFPGRSIIVSTPRVNGIPIPVSIDDPVNVRLFSSRLNGACAFRSSVIHLSSRPFSHMHLAMPESVELGEVRKSVRAAVEQIVSIRSNTGDRHSGLIRDLSVDGARLHSETLELETGQDCTVYFKCNVVGVDHLVTAPAVVCSAQHDDANHVYGVRFHDVVDADRIALHAFVLSHLQKLPWE